MTALLWLVLALTATAVGQLLFKYASTHQSRPWTLAAAASFCVAPPASYMALHSLSMATVYVSTAVVQLAVVLVSMLVFHERYNPRQWIGLGLILLGVIIFNAGALP